MINLIPKEEKKSMVADFYYRLGVVFFLMLGFCALVLSVSILPSYFISFAKSDSALLGLKTQTTEISSFGDQALQEAKELNNKINLIENSQKNKFLVSIRVINAILLKKRPDIKINQISYENDPGRGKKISILGNAPSREVLLLFRKGLEDNPAFKSVDLPISNFVRGSNIEFYLILIPA